MFYTAQHIYAVLINMFNIEADNLILSALIFTLNNESNQSYQANDYARC